MRKKILFVFALSLMLLGCSKGEEVVETVPTPVCLSDTSARLVIDDDVVTYQVEGSEALKSVATNQLVIYPDKTKFDEVLVDFVQGNSLNDFIQAYYNGIEGAKSDLVDGSFKTESFAYCLRCTDDYNVIIVRGPVALVDFVDSLCERL